MNRRFKISVCAVFRNEAPFILEWLRTHRLLGVEQFFLFDIGSDDESLAQIDIFRHEGSVTMLTPPQRGNFQEVQKSCYNYCLRRYGESTEWMAFLDVDEFLFDPSATSLHYRLDSLRHQSAVFVFWVPYGSSGHRVTPAQGVVRGLTRRSPVIENPELEHQWYLRLKHQSSARFTGEPVNGKSIVQPRIVRKMDIHRPAKPFMKHLKTAAGEPISESTFSNLKPLPSWDLLRINHYWARSAEALHEKADGRNLWSVDANSRGVLAKWDERISTVQDKSLVNALDHSLAMPRLSKTAQLFQEEVK